MFGQSCLPDGITFNSQTEVDQFIIDHPNCKEVLGNIIVNGHRAEPKITNIDAFANIIKFAGRVEIQNTELKNLNGLSNLREANELIIEVNDSLANTDGLLNLKKVVSLIIGGRDYPPNTFFNGLNGLDTVYQDLNINSFFGLNNFEGFLNLKYIGNNLLISNLGIVESISGFDNLNYIGGLCDITDVAPKRIEGFNMLEQALVIRFRTIWGLESISGFNNLRSVGFLEFSDCISDNTHIEAFQNLDSLGGLSFNNNNELSTIPSFTGIKQLGEIHIEGNENLKLIDGFSNINELVGINGGLTILENPNLESITGFRNLKKATVFQLIRQSEKLQDISGFKNLNEVTTIFSMNSNPGLKELDFPNLYRLGGWVIINGMSEISTLKYFEKVNMAGVGNLSILGNSKLDECIITPICEYISSGGMFSADNNQSPCNSKFEIRNQCRLDLNKLRYGTFYDLNQDGLMQSDEPLLSDIQISIPSIHRGLFTPIDSLGITSLLSNTYEIQINDNPKWNLTTDDLFNISLDSTACDTVLFGLTPANETSEMTSIISSPRARCNETITMSFSAKNKGNTFTSGKFWIELDSNIQELPVFINVPDYQLGDYRFGWEFSNLVPGQLFTQEVDIQVPGPLDFMLGDSLIFFSNIEYEAITGNHTTPSVRYSNVVRCSYDPNDKQVSPLRAEIYTLFEDSLVYTIRFQNTGNDVAYDVKITDILDESLDASTIKVLSSSHFENLNTRIENDQFLIFDFKNINLPDSTSNLQKSQGFVTFEISPKDGLAEFTPIKNTASIYFDFNPPIITNTTKNVMVSMLPTSKTKSLNHQINTTLYPNPTTGKIHLSGDNLQKAKITVTDLTGRILLVEQLNGSNEFDLPENTKGMLFVKIEMEEGVAVKRIIKK